MEDFIGINFSEYYNSIREEQNLRKVAKSLYVFLATPDEGEKYVQLNCSVNCSEFQLINTKPVIKNKLKELLIEVKNFNVQTILVLDYKKRNDRKIFYSCAKQIASDLDIEEAFKSMYRSIMTKIKNYASENCIVADVIIKHRIKIFEC